MLTSADINFVAKQVDIYKTYQRLNREDITTPPKTKKSYLIFDTLFGKIQTYNKGNETE